MAFQVVWKKVVIVHFKFSEKLYFTPDVPEANCVPQGFHLTVLPIAKRPSKDASKPHAKSSGKVAAKPTAKPAAPMEHVPFKGNVAKKVAHGAYFAAYRT